MSKWSGLALICACLSTLAWGAEEKEHPRVVSVTGQAEVAAAPDQAIVMMGVEARQRELQDAQKQVDESVAKFLDLCDELQIPRKQVTTVGLNVNPDYQWPEGGGKPKLVGYFVSRQLQVDLRDLGKLGVLMTRALQSGVTNVSPPQLKTSRAKTLERDALALAVEDAKARAEALAQGIGAKLGQARVLSSQQGFQPPPYPRAMAMMKTEAADLPPEQTYESGELKFSATVNAEFDLIPN